MNHPPDRDQLKADRHRTILKIVLDIVNAGLFVTIVVRRVRQFKKGIYL